MSDKFKSLYSTLKGHGVNLPTYEKFSSKMSDKAFGEEVFNELQKKGVDIGSHEDFLYDYYDGEKNFGGLLLTKAKVDAFQSAQPKDKEDAPSESKPQTDVELATAEADESKYQAELAENKLEWTQKQKPFGGSKPFGRVELGVNDKVVKSDDGTYLTESGRSYDNFAEANLDQNITDQHKSQTYRLSRMEEQLGEMKDRSGELLEKSKDADSKRFSQALGMGPYYGSMMRHESSQTAAIRKAQADLDDAQEALNELYRQRAEGGETHFFKNSWDVFANIGKGEFGAAIDSFLKARKDRKTTLDRVGRGFKDVADDLSNWDFGMTDAQNEGTLLSAILKKDNGQPLTKQEQFMLDAAALRAGISSEVGDLGLAYTAGNVTAGSLPFMIEMMANPLSGLGKGATKALTKYAVKKYGREAVKNNMKKYLATKAATRVTGDIVGSLGMTATTGIAGTVANAAERQIGSVQTAYDENGNIVYGGHVGGEDALTAYTKAIADRTIENWSEMSGAYFAALGAPIKAVIGKGIGRIVPDKVLQSDFAQWATKKYGDLKNSKFYKGIDAVKSRAQIGGLFEEYMEEKFGDLMRLSIGDTTFDTNSETGIFNLERNVETLVSLIPTQVGFGMLRLGGARTANYQYRQQRNAADKYLEGVLGEDWKGFRSQLDAAQYDPAAIAQIYTSMNQVGDSNLPINVRRAVISYINAQQSVLHSDPALYQSRVNNVDVEEKDGKITAYDKDAQGNILSSKAFETREEADAYATNRMEETRDDDMHRFMQTARGLDMLGYNQLSEQFMQERGYDNMTETEQAEFLDEMSSGRGKTGKAWIEFKTKTIENNMSGANFAISSWEQAHGLEPGTIEDILDRKPTERTIEESNILTEAYGMLHDLAYPQGKVHVDQSRLDGIKFADEANLDAVLGTSEEEAAEVQPNVDIPAEMKAKRDVATNIALNTLSNDTDMLTLFGEAMDMNGADAETVIGALSSMDERTLQNTLLDVMNEGVHNERFQSIVDAVNAQAAYDAFVQRTGEKIDERANRETNRRIFNGSLNGSRRTEKPTILTATDGEHTYQITNSTDDITTDENGSITSEGVITAIDENGNVVVFKGSPSLQITGEEESSIYEELMRQSLQESVSEIIEPTTEEEIAAENGEVAEEEVNETADHSEESGLNNQSGQNGESEENLSEEVKVNEEPIEAPNYEKKFNIPTDKKGNLIYHKGTVVETIESLYSEGFDTEEVIGTADANISEATKTISSLEKKKPKPMANPQDYKKAKAVWEEQMADAQARLAHWESVKADMAKITHSTAEDKAAIEEELSATGEAVSDMDMPSDGVAFASGFISDAKIQPESFRKETGYSTTEQKGFMGMMSRSGKTIEQLGEELAALDKSEYGGMYFHGDSNAARNAIIEALQNARTRADLKANASTNADIAKADYARRRDEAYYDMYGMSYEDYIANEEISLTDAIRNEAGVDVVAMAAEADQRRAAATADESNPMEEVKEEQTDEAESAEEVDEATQKENARREPLRQRARLWEAKTGMKVVLVESFEEVTNRMARAAISRGEITKGWFARNTGEVYIYLPYAVNEKDIDETFVHEVVAHKGLRELLGKSAFDSLCDNVWDMMSEDAKRDFLAYVGVSDMAAATAEDKRAAADEYIAHLAERTDLTDAEKSVWDSIVKMIRTALETLGLSISITDDVLSNLIKASYAEMVKNRRSEEAENDNEESEPNMGDAISFRVVDDPKVIAELEGSPKMIGYRNVVMNEDGTFSSPMAYWLQHPTGGAKTRVEMDKFKLGEWEEAVEHPEVVDENGKVTLVKPNKKTVGSVAYDPYIHNRLDPVNLQFKEAWKRNDLVYVETEVAETDLNSGYHADKALYPVGVQPWSNGALMLSKYDKPVRILPWEEVADAWAKRLDGKGVEFDVVPPALLPLLAERGVEILPPHKGMGKDCNAAYKEWKKKNKTSISERSSAVSGNSSSNGLQNGDSAHLSHVPLAHQVDVAKLQNNSRQTIASSQKKINEGGFANISKIGTAIRDIAKVLKLDKSKSSLSYYGDFYEGDFIHDGVTLHLRLSSHPANGARIGNSNSEDKVSIVIRKNGEHTSTGAHNGYVEYVYEPEEVSLTDAANAIIKGVNNLISQGEYIDETGKAHKTEYPYIDKEGGLRFRIANDNQEVFVSNAEQAVKGIKQEKATPQQWKAMIQSKGGLKAGEDKWLGLSEWLDEKAKAAEANGSNKANVITKQDVLDFIGENKIRIEEVEYGDANSSAAFASLKEEYDQWLREEGSDYAWEQLTDRYGDDAEIAFWDLGGELAISNEEAATALLGENVINSTRLDYTTEGLENKREIALTVPTIESWNESDEIHFGDAGQGRAVAWIRFGETVAYETINDVQEVTEFHEPYKEVNGHDIYKPVGGFKSGDFVVYGKGRDGNMIYVVYINGKQLPVAHATLDDARNAMNEYYREHPRKLRKPLNVLVIDEIQSKRHQEGREKGYKINLKEDSYDARKKFESVQDAMFEKYPEMKYSVSDKDVENILTEEDAREYFSARQHYYDVRTAETKNRTAIPYAPFDKNWHELAMKRMLRLAAEEGFDKVAWTKGAQQAKRYNLGTKINHIHVIPSAEERYVSVSPIGGRIIEIPTEPNSDIIISGEYKGKSLAEVFGKSLADKILSVNIGEDERIAGDGLHIGGEGMKGFYDKMLPSFMNKYGKKWGVKVGEVELPELEESGRTMWSVDVTPEMKESVMEGQVMFRKNTLNNNGEGESTQELFLSLQNKEGEEYNDTVNEIADRIVSGRARVGREDLQGRHGAQTQVSAAGEIISADRGRVSETVQQGSDASQESTRELIEKSIEDWARLNGVWMNEDIRFRFIGERGAANIDKANEATTMLDNLRAARWMEESGKDAKSIKMATGWERGADNQWKYEMEDNFRMIDFSGNVDYRKRNPEYAEYAKLSKKRAEHFMSEGGPLTEEEQKRFDDLKAVYGGKLKHHNSSTLKDYIEDDTLFEAYPELKDVKVVIEEREDGQHGKYSRKENTIMFCACKMKCFNLVF